VQAELPHTPAVKKKLDLHVNATAFDVQVAALVPQPSQTPAALTKYPISQLVDFNPVHVAALAGHLKH